MLHSVCCDLTERLWPSPPLHSGQPVWGGHEPGFHPGVHQQGGRGQALLPVKTLLWWRPFSSWAFPSQTVRCNAGWGRQHCFTLIGHMHSAFCTLIYELELWEVKHSAAFLLICLPISHLLKIEISLAAIWMWWNGISVHFRWYDEGFYLWLDIWMCILKVNPSCYVCFF